MRQPTPAAAHIAAPWRLLLAIIGLINLATGLWALLDPHRWYDDFPGFGHHHWVSGQGGAFNEHLAADAGAGFLAVGVVLLVGAAIGSVVAVRLAALALLAHALPHFLFHLRHGPEHLSRADKAIGTYSLLAEAVIAALVLVAAQPRSRH